MTDTDIPNVTVFSKIFALMQSERASKRLKLRHSPRMSVDAQRTEETEDPVSVFCIIASLSNGDSEGQGAVVCAAAVDAAIDAMVVNVARRFEVWWPLVLWRAMAFNFLNVGRCGGVGGDGGRRLWQWGLDEMVVNVARRSEVRWPLVLPGVQWHSI